MILAHARQNGAHCALGIGKERIGETMGSRGGRMQLPLMRQPSEECGDLPMAPCLMGCCGSSDDRRCGGGSGGGVGETTIGWQGKALLACCMCLSSVVADSSSPLSSLIGSAAASKAKRADEGTRGIAERYRSDTTGHI